MEPKDVVSTANFKGFTHMDCEFYPCHDTSKFRQGEEFNCLFCYCPLVWLECPGPYMVVEDSLGKSRKDCSACTLPHKGYESSWNLMNLSYWQKNPKPWKEEPEYE